MVTITLPSRGGGSVTVDLPARGERPTEPVGGGVYLTATDVNTPAAFQAAIDANPNAVLIAPTGTREWDMMSYGVEVDIAGAGELIFPPGFEIVSNCPVRGILRASNNTGLRIEGFRGRWEFDNGDILRPDLAWNESNPEMFDWINAWNAAFGTSISTALNGQGFNQRWNSYYTSLQTAAWNQISAGGRSSALLLNGCNEVQIYDFYANNCVAQINDQGGVTRGDGLYNFGTYIDRIKMGDDQRFGYLGKRGVATKIEQVICDVNGTRDNGGAPHIVYVSGNPNVGDVNTALEIGSVQITDWGIAPAIKVREASVNIGSIIGVRTQSLLGMVHCTGSIGPITSVDQKLARDADGTTITAGSGSKFAANFTDCYDLAVGAISVQQRASTGSLTQDNLRAADLAQCTRIKFEGFDVRTHRLSTAAAMVRLGEVTESWFGPSSIVNTGTNTVNLYEMPVDDDVGGANVDNHFEPVRTSDNAQVALLAGASKRNTFVLDPRLLTGGFEEDVNVQDVSFGASNNIALVAGERIVPVTSAPSFETKANDTFLANYTDDDEVDGDLKYVNFSVGDALAIDGRTYTFVSALTGNDQILRSSDLATNLKRVRAAMNGESLSGSGNGVIYQTASNHGTYFGVSSGRALTVINRTAGSAGNGDLMTTTATNGAWVLGASANGGELDTHHLNTTLAVTTGASTITITAPTGAQEGTLLSVVKVDTGVGPVPALGLATLRRKDERADYVYQGGGWRLAGPTLALKTLADQVITAEQVAACATAADVTALIQKAADAIGTAGGIVQLPGVTMTMGASAPVATNEGSAVILTTGANITFRGVPGSTVLRPASNKIELFAINGATGTRFEHIHFENTYGPLLNQIGGTFNEGDDPNGGVAAHGNTANCAIRQYRGQDLTVLDCKFTDWTTGVDYVGDNDSEATTIGTVRVQRCTFDGCAFAFLPKQPERIVFTDIDAYDIIDSNGYDSPFTITGITKANPGVVTTSGTHPFTDGEQVYIFGVGGMTEVNGIAFTCKSPTATTFQLYDTADTPAAVNTSGYTTYTTGGTAGEFNAAPGHAIYVTNRPGGRPDIVEIANVRATGCTSSPIKVRKASQCTISNINLLDNGRGIEVWNAGQLSIDNVNISLAAVSGGSEGNRNALQLTDNGPTEISNVTIDIRGIDAWGVRMLPDSPTVDYANQHVRLTNVTVIQDYVGTAAKAPMIASEQDDLVVEGFRHVHPGMKSGTRAPVDLRDCQRFRVSDVKHVVPDALTITGITAANPGVITTSAAHGLTTGDTVFIDGVLGMTRLNGQDGSVTVISTTTFSMGVNTSGYVAYSSGGKVYPADAPRLCVVDSSSNDGTFCFRTTDLAVNPTANTFSNSGTGNRLTRLGTPFVKENAQSTLTLNEHDQFLICNRAGSGAVTITLPAVAYIGQTHTITDYKGDAGTNNITISPNTGYTIKDGASVVINTNYGSATLTLVLPTVWKRTA